MKPIIGWWSILRPLVYVGLGIRDERDVIGIAVIGAGHWGPNLIRNFHDDEREPRSRWVVDRDAARLAQVARALPRRARVGRDRRRRARRPRRRRGRGRDADQHALRARTRGARARASTSSSRSRSRPTSAQGEELCALAEARGRVLMVGHVFLYNAGGPRA